MGELLGKWLEHYDPIHRGWTRRGIANGVCMTRGFAFPRIAGGYNLYRGGPTGADVDYTAPVGAAGARAAGIRTLPWGRLEAGAEYIFVLRSIGGGGVESADGEEVVRVAVTAKEVGWRWVACSQLRASMWGAEACPLKAADMPPVAADLPPRRLRRREW